MTATADPDEGSPPKKSKLPIIIGLVLALAGGGGGFFAVKSGLIPFGGESEGHSNSDDHDEAGHGDDHASEPGDAYSTNFAFVALDPIVVSLPRSVHGSLLRFTAQLEVSAKDQADVTALKPRIVDVLNGYLRAVAPEDLSDPLALARLRSQMLRRVQIVVGDGRVKDVLIMEFVVN